jgi:hypothetical protein
MCPHVCEQPQCLLELAVEERVTSKTSTFSDGGGIGSYVLTVILFAAALCMVIVIAIMVGLLNPPS